MESGFNDRMIDYFDYSLVLKILKPYKKVLSDIYQAYLNDEFEDENLDYSNPYCVLRYYENCIAYKKYNIKELAQKIKNDLSVIDFYGYSFSDYIYLEESYGNEIPHDFDQNWRLKDVYMYLVGLLNSNGLTIIETSIVNGEIISIFNCLLIRV